MSTSPDEKRAKNLEKALKEGKKRHSKSLGPFMEAAKSLQRASEADTPGMDPEVMARQRAQLMSKSEEMKEAEPVKEQTGDSSKQREPLSEMLKRPWGVWVKTLAPAGVVALIAIIVLTTIFPRSPETPGFPQRIADLIIPAAYAADAFTFEVETEDTGGAATDTAFIIESKIDLSEKDLRNHIVVIPSQPDLGETDAPPIGVIVEKEGDTTFRVTPDKPLDPGRAYKVEVRAAVQFEDGELQARTFSWALQTKDVFRVLSSVPGDASNEVPINTGIEVSVNMERLSDVKDHFTISPAVEGEFKTYGRNIAFVPKNPLDYGTTYTVTYSQDWGVEGSDITLGEDYVIRFETISKVRADAKNRNLQYIGAVYPYAATAPGREISVPVSVYPLARSPETDVIRIDGYALTADSALSYLEQERKRPWYCVAKRQEGELEQSFATQFAFSATSTVRHDMGWMPGVTLPSTMSEGFYLIKLTTKDNQSGWFFLNVTNLAAYVMADKEETLVWVMHANEARPMQGIAVTDGSSKSKTNAEGIARIKTDPALAVKNDDYYYGSGSSENENRNVILQVGEGTGSTLLPLSDSTDFRDRLWWYNWSHPMSDAVVSYLHQDRPLYRPTDVAEISGLIQDRETGLAPSEPVTVALMRNCNAWWCNEEYAKTYGSVTVTPDKQGFFRATLPWTNVQQSMYTIVLKLGDDPVKSQNVEVRNYVKPAYTLETLTDRQEVYAGEAITGTVRASFYDGTPMPNLALHVNGETRTTNEDGVIPFSFKTEVPDCAIATDYSASCSQRTNFQIYVKPAEAEESGDIYSIANVTVWNTDIALSPDWKTEFDGNRATVNVKARHIDLPRSSDDVGDPVENLAVKAYVVESWWEREETGTGYDPIDKTTYPVYRHFRRSEITERLEQTTDKDGDASFSFDTKDKRSYRLVVYAKDSQGRWIVANRYVYRCYYCQNKPKDRENGEPDYINIEPTDQREQGHTGYRLNEEVSLTMFGDGEPLERTSEPAYLYITSRMGMRDVKTSNDSTITFRYDEDLVPNASVVGVTFRNGGFRDTTYHIRFSPEERELTIDIATDHESYAPGDSAEVSVRVTDVNGRTVPNARVALAIVDEALFDVANYTVDENALAGLYEHVGSGIIFYMKSHNADDFLFGGGGGAEMGGGGNEAVRRNFKDTAAYEIVTTDAKGEGRAKIKLPDNITTWRVSGVAMTPDRYAGNARSSIRVTKRVFVNAVLPETFLASDRPQLKLRAYGNALKTGDGITYIVDAPTLNIDEQSTEAKVGDSVYLPIEQPVAGMHKAIITLKTSAGTDAIEKTLHVLESRFERDEGVREEVSTDLSLDPGTAHEINLSFVPKTRAQYLPELHGLRWNWSQRVEGHIAKQIAGMLLNEYFGEDVELIDDSTFLNYQKGGGIAILPHASSDAALSSRVAYVYPDAFDRVALAGYLQSLLEDEDMDRESQIEALAGLAALGEPVLLDLRVVAELEDLTWRERLSVIRGLVAIGDLEAARPHFNMLLDGIEEQDGRMIAELSEEEFENKEATMELAAHAIRLADGRADALRKGVRTTWAWGAYTPLAQADYLRAAIPAAIGGTATVTYDVNGDSKTIELVDGWPERVHLTADEARSFKVTNVEGPSELTYLKRVTTMPEEDARVKITRRYVQHGQTAPQTLKDGGPRITVELTATFAHDAPSGCYTIRDHVPAGLSALTSGTFWWSKGTSYVSPFEAENPTFVVCTGWNRTIRYEVKPSARGSYLAEPAVIQHMRFPSVTAISSEQRVTVE